MNATMKRCTICGQEKPLDKFSKKKTGKFGVHSQCKECRHAYDKRYYATNAQRISEYQKRYYRANTERILTRVKRYRIANIERVNQYQEQWRADHAEYQKEYHRQYRASHSQETQKRYQRYYAEHSERLKENAQRYRVNHPGKVTVMRQRRVARKRALPDTFTDADWMRCLDWFNHTCAYCGRPQGLWHTLAADHFIPLDDPDCPGTVVANIIPACHGINGCNNSKSAKEPKVWLVNKFGKRKAEVILTRIQQYFEWAKTYPEV